MGTINKILGKINKAKSAINSLKGISSKLKSLGYTSQVDKLGEQAEKARNTLKERRGRLEASLDASGIGKSLYKSTPTEGDIEYISPIHDKIDNYLVFTTRERQQREGENARSIFADRNVEIMLYVPDGHTSSNTVSYKNEGVGVAARGVMQTLNADKGDMMSKGFDALSSMIQSAMQSMLNGATGGLVNFAQGQAVNPMEEQMLDGVPMRSFDFEYVFWPKSVEEAEIVNRIIYSFRTAMLPDTFGSDQDSSIENYFNYPNIFDVEWEGPIGDVVEGFLPMMCTKCDVDHFNGGKVAVFTGGQPISTKMSLSFIEIKALTQESYQQISPLGQNIGGGTPSLKEAPLNG
jgi:hypothetical protein